jgi:hypothetical protein
MSLPGFELYPSTKELSRQLICCLYLGELRQPTRHQREAVRVREVPVEHVQLVKGHGRDDGLEGGDVDVVASGVDEQAAMGEGRAVRYGRGRVYLEAFRYLVETDHLAESFEAVTASVVGRATDGNGQGLCCSLSLKTKEVFNWLVIGFRLLMESSRKIPF